MRTNRRAFLKWSGTAGLAIGTACADATVDAQDPAAVPEPISVLRPMTAGIVPITIDERRARIDKARRLMTENRIAAILVEGGSSMFYFTGVRWGQSERPFVAVIPAKGELAWVCPVNRDHRLVAEAHARLQRRFVGEFGIRLEDCLYITENGPKFFTEPSPSIDRPFAE
jgi:Xaa-Pro dipeptidase